MSLSRALPDGANVPPACDEHGAGVLPATVGQPGEDGANVPPACDEHGAGVLPATVGQPGEGMGPMCLQPATNTVLGCSRPLLVSPVKVLDKHIQQDEALVRPPPSRPPSLPQRPSGKCLQHSSSACDLSILPKAGRAKQESLREAFRTPTTTASSCSQCSWSSPEAAAKPDLAAAAYELVPERLERMKLFKELVHAVAAPQPQAPAPASEAQRRRAKRRLQVPPKSMQRCGDLSEEEKEKEKEVAELLERLEKQLAEERDDSLCPFLCGVWQNVRLSGMNAYYWFFMPREIESQV
eukprot:s2201_g11.t1